MARLGGRGEGRALDEASSYSAQRLRNQQFRAAIEGVGGLAPAAVRADAHRDTHTN